MPKIVLIRHVTPIVDFSRCSANAAQQRLIDYNQTDNLLLEEVNAFQQTDIYQDILNIRHIFVSPLIRAQKTAEKLFPNRPFETLGALREFELKIIPLPWFKFSLNTWFALSRILWLFGLNKTERTFMQEKQRIRTFFPILSRTDNIIVAHGFILYEIKKYLKKQNFTSVYHQQQGCFSIEIFN